MTSSSLIFRQLFDRDTWTYTYLLADSKSKEAVLIDPVKEHADRDRKLIQELRLELKYVVDTHVHADHITGASELSSLLGAKTIVGEKSGVECADIYVTEGEHIPFGSHSLETLYTPGHTDHSYSFFGHGMVFTGDSLFIRGTGRTDFQSGSPSLLYDSIVNKLFRLPKETLVYPGHDYRGHTVSTIGEEMAYNPRIKEGTTKKDFIETMNNLNLDNPKRIHEAVPANLVCGARQ